MKAQEVIDALKQFENKDKAVFLTRFFKTGKGEYGYGDVFWGITVPLTRSVVKQYIMLPLDQVAILLHSPVHEHRLAAVLILAGQFRKLSHADQQKIYDFYLANATSVNNWDLVDSSAPHIVGMYLLDKKSKRHILATLAKSNNLWERRIAILATQTFIKHGEYDDTFAIAKRLLHDKHDLIHKAVGWMLREVGNKDVKAEQLFLDTYATTMPRTMLRYAIERFPPNIRKYYMQ